MNGWLDYQEVTHTKRYWAGMRWLSTPNYQHQFRRYKSLIIRRDQPMKVQIREPSRKLIAWEQRNKNKNQQTILKLLFNICYRSIKILQKANVKHNLLESYYIRVMIKHLQNKKNYSCNSTNKIQSPYFLNSKILHRWHKCNCYQNRLSFL